ncbi:MAG: hypothetical protein N2235_11650 [Fischerella sp.]|nr:hypothetical protein [Fischerella sp.]
MSDFPYSVAFDADHVRWCLDQIDNWCEEKFGSKFSVTENKQGTWCVFWNGRKRPSQYRYFFINKENALWFALTWGGNIDINKNN